MGGTERESGQRILCEVLSVWTECTVSGNVRGNTL